MAGLQLGSLVVGAPVVLAPMAGVTSAPFRQLCREHGPGLFIAEMVTARALLERNPRAMTAIAHGPGEWPRSIQLYGTDPVTVAAACRMVGSQGLADHIDLNFGCPVPKVTRRGGGAALPWKIGLFREIVGRAVDGAGEFTIPVTVKLRIGIDADHVTFLEAGQAARQLGAAGVALHARTAAQHYSGKADWSAIAELKRALADTVVLGNGDIWSAEDALAIVTQTGCDGVEIGRGCQGRPWLFADLAAGMAGRPERVRPSLGQVCRIVLRHAELTVSHTGDEALALRQMRHHMPWYMRGYPVGGATRKELGLVSSMAELAAILASLDGEAPCPAVASGPRGRTGPARTPRLPEGWLDSREIPAHHQFADRLWDRFAVGG